MARSMARLYVGDVGVIVEPQPKKQLPEGIDLSQFTFRELCNLAVQCGIDVRDIIAIEHCYFHVGLIPIGGNALPEGFNLFEHCNYCRNCWQFFRVKHKNDGYNENL